MAPSAEAAGLSPEAIESRVFGRGERVVLPGPGGIWIWTLAILIACSAAGVTMVVGPLSSLPFDWTRWDSPVTVVMGSVALLLFGVCGGPVALHGLLHHGHAVQLEPTGLRLQGGELVPWGAVHGVELQGQGIQVRALVRVDPRAVSAWRSGSAPLARWLHRFNRVGEPLPQVVGYDSAALGMLVERLRRRAQGL